MFHPLSEDYSQLKDAEIEQRVQDLSRKYFMAQNPHVKHQLATFIEIYKTELSVRRARQLEQVYQKRDKDLDKLINVK
jgi:hypothetical protein